MPNKPIFQAFAVRMAILLIGLATVSQARAASNVPGQDLVQGGLIYQWYQGVWDKLPDLSKETPVTTGLAQSINLSIVPATQNFAVRYDGFIDIAETGEYGFYTSSDDGSTLYVDNLPVVNNDGLHGMQTRWGSVVLTPGRYPFRVEFFQRGGGQGLDFGYRTPSGITSAIPLTALSYDLARLPAPREPDLPTGVVGAGLAYEYYEGDWKLLPTFDALQPLLRGVASGFDIADRLRNDLFGFRHQGYVAIPEDGVYTFYLSSDDGSALYVGDQKLVDNDGLHPLQERMASIRLKAGYHRITSTFFDSWADNVLNLQWSGPSFAKSPIPPGALVHTLDMLPPLTPVDVPSGPLLPQLAYRYYEGEYYQLPDFSTLPANGFGTAASIDTSVSPSSSRYGLSFKGYIQVPQDGVYRFFVNSDDGSRLWIGDKLVVDNDGPHGPKRVFGSIALAAGTHAIRVDYSQLWGGQVLSVEYRTPDGKLQVVPMEVLFHTTDQLPALVDAVAPPADLQDGLAYAYYEGYFRTIAEMQAAASRLHGVNSRFTLDPRGRNDGFGFVYDGYINVPEDGFYQFSTRSDDGSRLWIGDSLVVDNDGLHGAKTVNASIGLRAGLHPIRVAFMEYGGGELLSVSYRTPSGTLAEIPASLLHHTPAQLPALSAATSLPTATRPGVAYRYYEGSWNSLPDFSALTPVGLGAVANFSLETAANPDNFGFRFDAYVLIPADGFYDFYTNSDDGSRLWIDDWLVVDNDGLHGAKDAVGNIGLAAGWHRIRTGFFERGGAEILSVSWRFPGGQRTAIPNGSLVFDSASMPTLEPPAAARDALLGGLQYAYYEWSQPQAQWTVLPDLASLTPIATGTVESFSLAPRMRADRFAFRFKGYVDIPEYGYYTFFTSSDDGSRLYIDNKPVVDNDGLHGLRERSGRIGLERGRHAITVDFFEWTGDELLQVSYAGPHFGKLPVSPSVLFRLDPARNGNAGNPGQPEGAVAPIANLPPVGVLDEISTGIGAGQGVAVNVIGNDYDPDGDVPVLQDVNLGSGQGSALVDRATGKLVYYPPLGFVGDDRMSYTVSDRRGGRGEGQLAVHVGAGTSLRMSPAEASRFLTQASFGPTKPGIAEVMQKGAEAWIDAQLALPASTHADALATMRKTGENPSQRELRIRAWLDRAVNAPDQLRQRMAFALSEILVVSDLGNALGSDVGVPGAADYYDLLVRSAFGGYRQLLGDVTLHPAMGLFLNMAGNKKADPFLGTVPDENYAREIMQLFTLGLWRLGPDGTRLVDGQGQPIPTYAEGDVMELAKVFTGWNYAVASGVDKYRLPMVLDPSLHETAQKALPDGTVIPAGQSGEADLRMALDRIAAHPNLPPFIARELIQRLVTSNPSPAYIGRVAQAFSASGLNLGVAAKAILLDPEARTAPVAIAAGARVGDGKMREPLLQLTALWRGLGIDPAATRLRLGQLAPLGQAPLSAPSVFNFFKPDYQGPGAIANLGLSSPELEVLTEKQVMGSASVMDDWTLGGRSNYDLNMEAAYARGNPGKILGHLDLLFMGKQMSPVMRQTLTDGLFDKTGLSDAYTDVDRQVRTLAAVYLILTSPEFQTQR